ncbi:type IV pilus biogenesis protein PilM [Virgibacillus ndiopensis]|uniref:type IV pilus biogenesis protein PilM n=1 Tax=Virgibacillus ndiopensis TaxID=2004408 RepID=UPI000C087ABD|nr:pilus assembly protein PilM [Virgibacillus ndiopensis]
MRLVNNGRVNIVITNRVLRYTYHKNPTNDGLITHGEVELPKDTIKDGTIVNKLVFTEIMKNLVQQHNWKRKRLNFCVPDDTVVIRQLEIPASLSKAEALGYIHTQIGNRFYLPFPNPAISIEFLEVDEKNRNILLYAYPKEKIAAFEDVFAESGLKSVVADLTSLSVFRYYYMHRQAKHEHILHIHWNHDALVLTAFKQDKAIFTRYMKIVTNDVTLNAETANQVINEFVIEINRIVDFYQFSITKGEATINMLVLSGDFLYLDSVKTVLSNTVTLPIYSFEEEELAKKYVDVLGLALKQDV